MYIIGIDGGGTKTSLAVFDIHGKFYGICTQDFPSSIDTISFSEVHMKIKNSIIDYISNLFPQEEHDIQLSSVFFGLGGIVSQKDSDFVEKLVKTWEICTPSTVILARNDIYSAHAAGLLGQSGICFIIGTGSVGFGMDDDGNVHRVGGYSHLEGDPGSSYHLGRMVLKNLAKALDSRIPFTPLLSALKDQLNITGYTDFVKTINSITRTETAQLAKLVTFYAESDEKMALQLINRATDEIILMLTAITNNLTINKKNIVLIGSLGCKNTPYKEMLLQKIALFDSEYSVSPSQRDPVIGSAILAFKQINNLNYTYYLDSNYN